MHNSNRHHSVAPLNCLLQSHPSGFWQKDPEPSNESASSHGWRLCVHMHWIKFKLTASELIFTSHTQGQPKTIVWYTHAFWDKPACLLHCCTINNPPIHRQQTHTNVEDAISTMTIKSVLITHKANSECDAAVKPNRSISDVSDEENIQSLLYMWPVMSEAHCHQIVCKLAIIALSLLKIINKINCCWWLN